MKTKLKTVHEEEFSDGSKVLGVLLNFTEDWKFKESFLYIYNRKRVTYVFFNTLIDLYDYMLYGEGELSKMKRAYMEEFEFDQYYDAPFINSEFNQKLNWI